MFTAHALQQEFEPREFRLLWSKVNHRKHSEMMDQPVLRRWEHVSLSFSKYLRKIVGFFRLCTAICNIYKPDNNKNKIASDHVSLAN